MTFLAKLVAAYKDNGFSLCVFLSNGIRLEGTALYTDKEVITLADVNSCKVSTVQLIHVASVQPNVDKDDKNTKDKIISIISAVAASK